MDRLEYTVLIEAYEHAVVLNLETDFIQLLKKEIQVRQKNNVLKDKKEKIPNLNNVVEGITLDRKKVHTI
ncbi:sporulation histidine kinase inhibitor Sda [Alkalihalobacillus deserti]|uniref:sporulation histidine kinase inhibitor Sda n=1 Tax=Alkalihalobacillus deserti TaxID=2879466 RepID=UPI001D157A8E|nr:sporulation histidine kinase inhibitor Sda [Alkalihalobacillus deserti]